MKSRSIALPLTLALAACAHAPPPSAPPAPAPPPVAAPTSAEAPPVVPAVLGGELPWWAELPAGIYQYAGGPAVLAVGGSSDHHHVAEGFLRAKVNARLRVRRAAEPVRFTAAVPEPELLDLFLTRDHRFLALFLIRIPEGAGLPPALATLAPPPALRMAGRRRVGRHIYEDAVHLYLECEVEGPVSNPDWGRSRASARP